MALINLGKLVYLWRGDYSASAAYAAYDVCRYLNKVYICTADAAAGENPASVPVKWDLMTEGIPATADVGTDGQVLTSNGPNLAPSFQATQENGVKSIQVFDASGTWTKPADVTKILVEVVGGGGGGQSGFGSGGGGGGGGGAGGYSRKLIGVGGISSVPVTVGAGGDIEATGSTSSFGGYCSATGGVHNPVGEGGSGGAGSGGDINTTGGDGQSRASTAGGHGGGGFFGGGGHQGVDATTYGGGGGGGYYTSSFTGKGYAGIVIVQEYE